MKIFFRFLFSMLFIGGGLNHFLKPDFYIQMVPPYIPAHEFMVQLSGVIEIALGIMLNIPRLQKLAGWGLMGLLLAVLPANLHMAMHSDLFPDFKEQALWGRVVMQMPLIAWAFYYARCHNVVKV